MESGIVEGGAELGSLVALRKNAELFLGTIVLTGKTQQFKNKNSLAEILGMIAKSTPQCTDCIGYPACIE